MKTTMKRRAALLLALVLAVCVLLGGCADSRHYASVEKKALKYYEKKYGVKGVEIVDSYVAGNSGLFGYLGVKDRAYELSDGHSIYWDDGAELFADNAQAEQILADFEREILDPLLAQITFERKGTAASLNRTDYESFDDCVFTTYYDGDIRSYLEETQPRLSGLTMAVEAQDRDACEREIEAFHEGLKDYVSGSSAVYILNGGLADLDADSYDPDDNFYVDIHDLNVTAKAYLNYDGNVSWYRQNFVEIAENIFVTSSEDDFSFEEGDVRFEIAGTCADLQAMLDEAYYAMPVDAEENKNGGYMVHDQRHETRVELDDPEAPLYRVVFSQRVLDALDEHDRIGAYWLDCREDGAPLMMYYGQDSNTGSYSVYRVCERGADRTEFHELSSDFYYYFGTHQRIKYGE